jgi:hypothetical protein
MTVILPSKSASSSGTAVNDSEAKAENIGKNRAIKAHLKRLIHMAVSN